MFKTFEHRLKNALRPLLLPWALRALQSETTKLTTIESTVDLAFRFRHWGIRFTPSQVREEITGLLNLLARRPPTTVLEIGIDKGGTFFLLSRLAAPDAFLLSLDLPASEPSAYPRWRERLYRSFAREQQRIELIREDSHDSRTMEKVKHLLDGRTLDLLFIDGDHSYSGVEKDFKMYAPLVAPDGLIAFHDIVPGVEASVGGVPKFWREIKQTRSAVEFVKSWEQGGWGVGALQKKYGECQ